MWFDSRAHVLTRTPPCTRAPSLPPKQAAGKLARVLGGLLSEGVSCGSTLVSVRRPERSAMTTLVAWGGQWLHRHTWGRGGGGGGKGGVSGYRFHDSGGGQLRKTNGTEYRAHGAPPPLSLFPP